MGTEPLTTVPPNGTDELAKAATVWPFAAHPPPVGVTGAAAEAGEAARRRRAVAATRTEDRRRRCMAPPGGTEGRRCHWPGRRDSAAGPVRRSPARAAAG